jgi:hypothetical protein
MVGDIQFTDDASASDVCIQFRISAWTANIGWPDVISLIQLIVHSSDKRLICGGLVGIAA